MKCLSCGNTTFERLDQSIVQCTSCYAVWNPFIFPGFPDTEIEIGQIWDSEEDDLDEWDEEEEDDLDEDEEEEDF